MRDLDTLGPIDWGHDTAHQRTKIYVCELCSKAFLTRFQRNYKAKMRNVLFSFKNFTDARACYHKRDIKDFGKSLINLLIVKPRFAVKILKMLTRYGRKLIKVVESFTPDKLPTMSKRKILEALNKAELLYIEYMGWIIIPELSIDYVEDQFHKELEKRFGSKARDFFAILTANAYSTYLNDEENELRIILEMVKDNDELAANLDDFGKLRASLKKNPKLWSLIEKHTKRFFWINFNYVDTKPLKEVDFVKKLVELAKEKPVKINQMLSRKENLLKKLNLKKKHKLSALISALELLPAVQDRRKAYLIQFAYHMNELFKELANRTGIAEDHFCSMKYSEIIDVVKTGKFNLKKLEKRKKRFIAFTHDQMIDWYNGETAIKVEKKIAPVKIKKNIKEFRGRIASAGKAKGRVALVTSATQIKKVKKGNILVSSNTTPDYLPAMEKAAAIITEKGGIASHAAVVSRELGVPCVTGILNITNVLKDGDIVEVDADEGVVRKIE